MFNEGNIIKNAKNGDKQAMGQLYHANFKSLYIFIRSKVDSNERAEDICSEAFIKAFENINKFEGKSSFKSWLYTIAKNIVFDWYEKKNKEINVDMYDESIDNKFEDKTIQTEENNDIEINKIGNMIKKIFNELQDNYRQVLELRFLSNYSIKETAEIMNIKPNNVKIIQNRAIKKAQLIINKK